MKKLILMLILLIMITVEVSAQADKVVQVDSLRAAKDSTVFTINSRHNYNTIFIKDLVVQDTIALYNINESGYATPVAIRDLNTYLDLESNKIRGLSGNHEFLILHPNLYKLAIAWDRSSALNKTIPISRRGNNLK